jgi:hypothetical protein
MIFMLTHVTVESCNILEWVQVYILKILAPVNNDNFTLGPPFQFCLKFFSLIARVSIPRAHLTNLELIKCHIQLIHSHTDTQKHSP